MKKYRLQPFTVQEKKSAEREHDAVYAFLHQYDYPVSKYYDIALMGFFKGIQVYHRKSEIRKQYGLFYVCWQYMRDEVMEYHQQLKQKMRSSSESAYDFDYMQNSFVNCVYGEKHLETEYIVDMFEHLTERQQRIILMMMNGYSERQIFERLDISNESFSREMKNMRAVIRELME